MATNTGILDLVKPAGNENALISVINSNMDKVDAEAGRSRGNIAANYSTSSAYDVGDLCIYQGNLYRCNTAIASGEEWTAAHWTQVNIAGELDSQKQDITSNTQAIANIKNLVKTNVSKSVTCGSAIAHFPGSGTANVGIGTADFATYVPAGKTLFALIPGQATRSDGVDVAYSVIPDNSNTSIRIYGTPNGTYTVNAVLLYY